MASNVTLIPLIAMDSKNMLEEVTTDFKNMKYQTTCVKTCNGERPSNPIVDDPAFTDQACQTDEYMVDKGTQYNQGDYMVLVNAQDGGDGAENQYYWNKRIALDMEGTTQDKITILYIASIEKASFDHWYMMLLLSFFCTVDDLPPHFRTVEDFKYDCWEKAEMFNIQLFDTMSLHIPLPIRGVVEGIFPGLNLSAN